MSSPITRRENLRAVRTDELHNRIIHEYTVATGLPFTTPTGQQKMFNLAHELISRSNKNMNQAADAMEVLRDLARFHGRTWTNHPSSDSINLNNYNSNSNNNSNNSNKPNSNNSKVRKFAERWRLKGAVKLVNLPTNKNNRTDPVSLHAFRAGQEAVRHQRRNAEGRVISTRYYLLPTIERLAGVNWKTIRRMHPNKVLVKGAGAGTKFLASKHVPNVITRLPMYRRNLTLVKFK